MKALIKLGAVILPLAMLTACANTAEMDKLKASVTAAQSTADEALQKAKLAQGAADTAQHSATDASMLAMKAQKTADSAKAEADDNSAKIDRMFQKAMSK